MPKITILPNHQTELSMASQLMKAEEYLKLGCRAGSCGLCAIEVIEGMKNLSPADSDEIDMLTILDLKADKYRLACQCKVFGDITIKNHEQ